MAKKTKGGSVDFTVTASGLNKVDKDAKKAGKAFNQLDKNSRSAARAGKGVANPIGQIWASAMMLDHLGQPKASTFVLNGIETILQNKHNRTPDLGGTSDTRGCTNALLEELSL